MQALLDLFRPGRTIYLPGASGETLALAEALAADPNRMRGVHIVSCLLPGVNNFDYAALDPESRITTFLLPAALRTSFEAGRVRILPLAYSGVVDYFGERQEIDVAVAHVSVPDADGLCSLGIAADFTPIAWRKAKIRALVINAAMPAMKRGPRLSLADADVVIEVEGPLVCTDQVVTNAVVDEIARSVAEIVPDGAAVQIGLGTVPAAVWPHLTRHRNLTIASGQVANGVEALEKSGALRPDARHRAGIALGGTPLHRFLAEEDLIEFAPATETHGADIIASIDRFTAINSAIEVDLFGQGNLEWQNGRLVSGVGGAPDFARGALRSAGGRSIIALNATAKGGVVSRIAPRLDTPTVSLTRTELDTVITEYGVAELRDRSIDERAEALIAIAAPQWREPLASQWSTLRKTL